MISERSRLVYLRNYEQLAEREQRLLRMSIDAGLKPREATAIGYIGLARLFLGEQDQGVRELTTGMDLWLTFGAKFHATQRTTQRLSLRQDFLTRPFVL
jgi:hypothetical protein